MFGQCLVIDTIMEHGGTCTPIKIKNIISVHFFFAIHVKFEPPNLLARFRLCVLSRTIMSKHVHLDASEMYKV